MSAMLDSLLRASGDAVRLADIARHDAATGVGEGLTDVVVREEKPEDVPMEISE